MSVLVAFRGAAVRLPPVADFEHDLPLRVQNRSAQPVRVLDRRHALCTMPRGANACFDLDTVTKAWRQIA